MHLIPAAARTRQRAISRAKAAFASLWIGLFLVALLAWWRSGVALTEIPSLLETWLRDFGLLRAACIYILFYAIRPLILFPATLLTVASGLIFGPWLGTLFTVVGENASANFAFFLARWLGRSAVAKREVGWLRRWDRKLEENGLFAVLTMRLIMLPFDAVNFGCGLTAIRQRDYALGTFFGILPSLVGFVLLGGIAAPGVHHRALILVLSLGCMALGFGMARWLKLREARELDSGNSS